jgi:hypothetical protein
VAVALEGSRRQVDGRAIALLGLAVLLSGCHKVWRADTVQPPPLLGAGLEARTSLPAVISVGDMTLPRRMRLDNTAYFVVVSKDRLRVHVVLRQRAEDLSDPRRWRVTLIDSLGRRYAPSGFDRRDVKPVTLVFNQLSLEEQRYYQAWSDAARSGVTFFQGDGDFTFYRADLYRRDVRWMMLVLERPGYEYRYVWSFHADPAAGRPGTAVASLPADL